MRLRTVSVFDVVLFLLVIFFQNYSSITPKVPSVLPTPTISVLAITSAPGYSVVTKVVDGDTITVVKDSVTEKVRLIGIDTPEVVDPRKPVQCFGKEASIKMKELVSGKNVKLVSDPSQDNKDKYGRSLRYVFLENGTLVNRVMIEEGYAYEYTYDIPYQYQTEFRQAQKNAQNRGKGLWGSGVCPSQ